jgi:hypothetical protein
MSPNQEQQKHILNLLDDVWVGMADERSLVAKLRQIAVAECVELEHLTDAQIERWLQREVRTIERMCTGSVLNG